MFLRELLLQIFISSQRQIPTIASNLEDLPTSRNRVVLEEIFIRATRIQSLSMGLVYFISEAFHDLSSEEKDVAKLIKWTSDSAKDTLQTGVDSVLTI